jgi:steroid delta-isomerase-like uncharacterized protein
MTAREDSQRNAAMMRRWFTEGWTKDSASAKDLFSPAFRTNGELAGIEGPRATVEHRLAAFPDLRSQVEDLIAVDDKVIVRVRWTGTQTGDYAGVPATGKPVDVRVISIWRFENGRAVENWTLQDQLSLLKQVGYLPDTIREAQVAPPKAPEVTASET